MHASILLALVATIQAAPLSISQHHQARAAINARADADILGAFDPVLAALKTLDTSIKGLTTDPQSAIPIVGATDSVQKALDGATSKITAAQPLTLGGAISLQQVAGTLQTQSDTTIADLTAKKPILDQLGVTKVAVDGLQKQKTATAGLSTALLAKVPAIAKTIAKQSTDKISATLDTGIKAMSAPPAAGAAPPPAAPAAPGAKA